ncbi:hypothetical protein Dacet_0484 [Denitrovibrio acetiphilus DSM 12809]|uniref:Prepilin-type N-terminal cleavage/methylation domain-containing protein n=1 Tax=Denitrovibrio acetiphilus (strain DSM 12809 / NBRC 114555 / N2460) TaxID=522772 RepID=D4H3X1_DENA2|nr:prepilin-type N-terminal cleavage/methylation domain-containing protein [Denitrovibrio acetiphilus]ADD67282.1 hypothetical protein Dacet_0484 [Denitrovibrio acetiphilus DSM 12809]
MSITNSSKNGFTILEMLIALVLSVMVVTGVYTTFDSLLNTKEATEASYYRNNLLLSARRVIKPDILQMYRNSLSVTKGEDNDILQLVTNNSIKMEKAFPVTVRYYVDDDDYLIREETSEAHDYEWKLYLMPNVDNFEIQSHNGDEFTDYINPSDKILKISFEVNGHEVIFIAGCSNPSLTADYLGEGWQ